VVVVDARVMTFHLTEEMVDPVVAVLVVVIHQLELVVLEIKAIVVVEQDMEIMVLLVSVGPLIKVLVVVVQELVEAVVPVMVDTEDNYHQHLETLIVQ
tara:strand:+ start:733 stop:1026 length:294 start_codon:yes stop_codon:yes gene_type:complete